MSSVDFLADLGPSADVRAVARVLSAAAAPPWPHELRGYESARRAFENAGAAGNTGTTPVRHSVGIPVRRLLGVKLAAVAGALGVAGVAVAAEADVLPSPIQRAAHQVLGGVGVPEPDPASRTGQNLASSPGSSGSPGSNSGQLESSNSPGSPPDRPSGDRSTSGGLLPGSPAGTGDTSASSGLPGQSPSTAADVLALCRAYVAHPGNQNDGGNANSNGNGNGNGGLNAHDRRVLAALAGGADKIGDYCARVLAAASTSSPIPQPTDVPTTPSKPQTQPVSPDPSHDHKPSGSTSSSPSWSPLTSESPSGGASHTRTPNPSRHAR